MSGFSAFGSGAFGASDAAGAGDPSPSPSPLTAPSPLGSGRIHASYDFTSAVLDSAVIYIMDLDTPSGMVRVPISSWQATLRAGSESYVQCVIPACGSLAATINTATEFVISRSATLPDGTVIEAEMARAPASTAQFDQGPQRHTCTLSGYGDAFTESDDPDALFDRTLTGVRSISSGATNMRVRCAIDWLLRPGQRAFVDGTPFVVGYINYYVPSNFDAYMDAGQ